MPEETITDAKKQTIELSAIQTRIKQIETELPVLRRTEKALLEYLKLKQK